MKVLKWPGPSGPPRSKRPYRDAALVYAGFAGAIVVFAALTGGSLSRAAVTAAFFFVVATAWTWFRMHRKRLREEAK